MAYQLDFSNLANKDIEFHKNSGNKVLLKKMLGLFNELTDHPFEGTGKPELLKHNLSGYWSRRINLEHWLIYEVIDNRILTHSAKGHYF